MSTDKKTIKKIKELLKECCDKISFKNYYKTAEILTQELENNEKISMDNGPIEEWVAGILYIVGEDSGLFNKENKKHSKLYLSKTDLSEIVGVSIITMRKRADEIIETLPGIEEFAFNINLNKSKNKIFEEMGFPELAEYEMYFEKLEDVNSIDELIDIIKLIVGETKKKIPESTFEKLKGQLWLDADARPYLVMKDFLAYAYCLKGDNESAIEIYSDILKLDVEDNLGIKGKMFPLLILLDEKEKIEALIKAYDDDKSAVMLYNKALYYYKEKNELAAKSALKQAFEANQYVPEYLLNITECEEESSTVSYLGTEEEAISYVNSNFPVWAKTEGAFYWIRDEYFSYVKRENINLEIDEKQVNLFIRYVIASMKDR